MIVHQDNFFTLHCGDVLAELGTVADRSWHCVVTSPPYWGLRDYGIAGSVWGGDPGCEHEWVTHEKPSCGVREPTPGTLGKMSEASKQHKSDSRPPLKSLFCSKCGAWRGCLGLEPTVELYVEHMVMVFREVHRVLRDDGTLWLNIGDSYAGSGKGIGGSHGKVVFTDDDIVKTDWSKTGLKPTDMCMVPARLALALQADGWFLRSDIIWEKKNPMPESVRSRPSKSHEYIYLLAKSQRYFFDAEAIRERGVTTRPELLEFGPRPDIGGTTHMPDRRRTKRPDGWASHAGGHGSIHRDGREHGAEAMIPFGRNCRSVWSMATKPYRDAHFATFPPELPERCIKAGTSEHGVCAVCGKPWVRRVARTFVPQADVRDQKKLAKGSNKGLDESSRLGDVPRGSTSVATTGWAPSCSCGAAVVPAIVGDPFGGTCTTAREANKLGRRAVCIEINEKYCRLAMRRNHHGVIL